MHIGELLEQDQPCIGSIPSYILRVQLEYTFYCGGQLMEILIASRLPLTVSIDLKKYYNSGKKLLEYKPL